VILVGKPEGNEPLAGSRQRRYDNKEMDLRDIEWRGMGWSHLLGIGLVEFPCEHGNEAFGFHKILGNG
jgi:hypothetical protein